MEHKRIIVAGHICIDITPVFPSESEAPLSTLLTPGKLIHMDPANISTGGTVANTGLALKTLGADVELMGKVGRDDFGSLILARLKEWGLDTGMIVADGATTSYSIVVAPIGVDRIFLHHTGANDTFCSEDLDYDRISDAGLFHFGYPPLMRRMYEEDGEELVNIFRRVHDLGVATSLDMAAVDPASPAGRVDWRRILERVLPYVDFVVPSVEEICFMLDRERWKTWQTKAAGEDLTMILDVENDIVPLAKELVSMGASVVLLKCGAPGMYCCTAGADKLNRLSERLGRCFDGWADRSVFERSYKPDIVRSGTGAGDTSIAAFLLSTVRGYSFERCLQLCTGTGAMCVTSYDALGGLIPLEALEKRINAGWEKQVLI